MADSDTPDPDYPILTACVSWSYQGSSHVRVYSSDSYDIIERCQDDGGDWYNGEFTQPGGQVSATCYVASDGPYIRVYVTGDSKTTEWICNPGGTWTEGSYTTLDAAVPA